MTDETMELLEQVLRQQTDIDDYIGEVADALYLFRETRDPLTERALCIAARDYLGYI